MTYDEYLKENYIAHGGKWGFTNGVPNGKKKAEGLLDEANRIRKAAGKQANIVGKMAGKQISKAGKAAGKQANIVGKMAGKQVNKAGRVAGKQLNKLGKSVRSTGTYKNVAYGTQTKMAEAKMRLKLAVASSKAKKGMKVKIGKEPVNTQSTELAYVKKVNGQKELVFDNKNTKVSKNSFAAAKKYQNEAAKIVNDYVKSTGKSAKKYGKKKQQEKDLNKFGDELEKKYGKLVIKANHQLEAGEAQTKKENAIIKKAKVIDKLRYPNKNKGQDIIKKADNTSTAARNKAKKQESSSHTKQAERQDASRKKAQTTKDYVEKAKRQDAAMKKSKSTKDYVEKAKRQDAYYKDQKKSTPMTKSQIKAYTESANRSDMQRYVDNTIATNKRKVLDADRERTKLLLSPTQSRSKRHGASTMSKKRNGSTR